MRGLVGLALLASTLTAAPTITSLSPNKAKAGSPPVIVTITGLRFASGGNSGALTGASFVTVNGIVQGGVVVRNPNEITFPFAVPSTPGSVAISVSTPGYGSSSAAAFIITPDSNVPFIFPGGVVNAASGSKLVSPGSLVAIYGQFPISAGVADALPLPFTLSGLVVQFGGVVAPLLYASSGQVNAQIPWEAGSLVEAIVGGVTSAPEMVELSTYAPGIFSVGLGGAILDEAYRLVDEDNPAVPGSTAQVFCTGLGPVTNQPKTGQAATGLSWTIAAPTVSVGGIQAQVTFAGLTPGTVGLYQVNVVVPQVTGPVPVNIVIGGISSNSVMMWVR